MVKKNFNRKSLYNSIYKNLGFSKNLSSEIVDNFFETLIVDLIKTNKVKITSFGTFEVFNKDERIGRNPKTRVETKISKRKVVRFKPSLSIKRKINE